MSVDQSGIIVNCLGKGALFAKSSVSGSSHFLDRPHEAAELHFCEYIREVDSKNETGLKKYFGASSLDPRSREDFTMPNYTSATHTGSAVSDSSEARRLDPMLRIMSYALAFSPQVLTEECRRYVKRLGLMLLANWAVVVCIVGWAFLGAFSTQGMITALAVGAGYATLVLLIDVKLIGSTMPESGLEEAVREGARFGLKLDKWGKRIRIGVRMLIAGLMSWLTATLLATAIFSADIEARITRLQAETNAAIVEDRRSVASTESDKAEARKADAQNLVAADERRLAELTANDLPLDLQQRRENAGKERQRLLEVRSKQQSNLLAHRKELANYMGSRLAAPLTPGFDPCDRTCLSLRNDVASDEEALRQTDTLVRGVAQIEREVDAVWAARMKAEAPQRRELIAQARVSLNQSREELAEATSAAQSAMNHLGASVTDVSVDPRHVEESRGLLSRIQALDLLYAENPALLMFSLLLKTVIFLLETSSVLATIVTRPPPMAVRWALSRVNLTREALSTFAEQEVELLRRESDIARRRQDIREQEAQHTLDNLARERTAAFMRSRAKDFN